MDGLRAGLYAAMFVVMHVHAQSDVEITAQETVRLDRAADTDADGFTADRHGDLLQPGTNRLRLDQGVYHFRTLYDARLWVSSADSVTVVAPTITGDPKDPWPPSADRNGVPHGHGGVFDGRGPGRVDRTPTLALSYGEGA